MSLEAKTNKKTFLSTFQSKKAANFPSNFGQAKKKIIAYIP